MSGWIKCSDRLPDAGVVVLASGFKFESCGGGRWVEPVIYDEGCYHPLQDAGDGEYVADFDGEMNEVTHWQPLPSPPTE